MTLVNRFGVNVGDDGRRTAQQNPGDVQPMCPPDLGREVVAELMGAPSRDLRLAAFRPLSVGPLDRVSDGLEALIGDADPAGRFGSVRVSPGSYGPFVNLNFYLPLTDKWSYECED